jgi:hypothetical protein
LVKIFYVCLKCWTNSDAFRQIILITLRNILCADAAQTGYFHSDKIKKLPRCKSAAFQAEMLLPEMLFMIYNLNSRFFLSRTSQVDNTI